MKLFSPFLLAALIIMSDGCKKSCTFPDYEYQNNLCWSIGHKYLGDYYGTSSSSVSTQNVFCAVFLGTKTATSLDITRVAPDAEVDAQGNFVVDTQHIVDNTLGFTIFGSGYFKDTLQNELMVANIYYIPDSPKVSPYWQHFAGIR